MANQEIPASLQSKFVNIDINFTYKKRTELLYFYIYKKDAENFNAKQNKFVTSRTIKKAPTTTKEKKQIYFK